MKPEKMTDDQVQNAVRTAIREAIDYCEETVAKERIRAEKYLQGHTSLTSKAGNSQVVSTVCRDTVRMVKPVLMRTFMQSGTPVEFVPVGQDDIQTAEQATEYVNWKFNENNGFRVLSNLIDDALEKKTGIVKVWWDDSETVEFDEYSNLEPEAVLELQLEDGVEVLEAEQNDDGTLDLRVSKTTKTGEIKTDVLAPEDFFVDREATSVDSFFVIGDTQEMRVGDLVEQGFDFETVYNLAGRNGTTMNDEEEAARQGSYDDDNETPNDPSMRIVTVTNACMRMDIEGTGIPRLYQFTCAGDNFTILETVPCDDVPYAVFEVDPRPHQFFGWSLVDLVIEDQDPMTSLLRATIDNAHHTNNPRTVVTVGNGSIADATNGQIGATMRQKSPGGYEFFATPSNIGAMLPMLDHYKATVSDKAGVSKSSLGMDADALQSTTAAGVNAAVQAASAHAELMARNLAEGGMRRLFRLMLRLTHQHAPRDEMMRLNGEFTPVDPRSWNVSMNLRSRIGLGTGQKEQRIAALQQVLVDQQQIWQAYGPNNPIVTISQMYNTRADLLELAGVHSTTRYYTPMNPQKEAQWQQQQAAIAAQQPQQPPDPYLAAEGIKAQVKAAENEQKHMREIAKGIAKDDLDRDKMAQDRQIAAAKLQAETGVKLNQQAIMAEQNMQRQT